MNTIDSYSLMGPFGIGVPCPRIKIENTLIPFVLAGVANPNRTHALSFWLKSDAESQVDVCGKIFTSSPEWQQCVVTFTPTTPDIQWWFGSNGYYYIYHAQLEDGNIATDWAPAPEDTESRIDNLKVGARNLIRNSSDLIFDNYSFVEPMMQDIISNQESIISDQDALTGETTTATPETLDPVDLETMFDEFIEQQGEILTLQNTYIGGDA